MSEFVKPMRPQWTGGQYSIFRVLFGLYLAVHFAHLLPYAGELFSSAGILPTSTTSPLFNLFPGLYHLSDSPLFVSVTTALGVVLSLAFACGWRDRTAAVLLWFLLASEFTRNPLISNPSLAYVGLMLIVCALQAPAPYGSVAARGRLDPAGDWQARKETWGLLWFAMALGYSYSGWVKLQSPSWQDGTALLWLFENPLARTGFVNEFLAGLPEGFWKIATWASLGLELVFAPFALFPRVRLLPWLGLLGMHIGILFVIDFADLTLAMILLHLATFDPAWLAPKRGTQPAWIFYDGECGLCHRTVRMILAEDASGEGFVFAPLGSPAFEAQVTPEQRASLPDSIALLNADGHLLIRTRAVIAILDGLGGLWRALAFALRLLPRPIADAGYDFIARIRKSVFAKPDGVCPMLPPHLGERFKFDAPRD
jgi:predicted DCC family thiol-disulfide oxidoreductase YuxK